MPQHTRLPMALLPQRQRVARSRKLRDVAGDLAATKRRQQSLPMP